MFFVGVFFRHIDILTFPCFLPTDLQLKAVNFILSFVSVVIADVIVFVIVDGLDRFLLFAVVDR